MPTQIDGTFKESISTVLLYSTAYRNAKVAKAAYLSLGIKRVTVNDLSWFGKAIIIKVPLGQMCRKLAAIANCFAKETEMRFSNHNDTVSLRQVCQPCDKLIRAEGKSFQTCDNELWCAATYIRRKLTHLFALRRRNTELQVVMRDVFLGKVKCEAAFLHHCAPYCREGSIASQDKVCLHFDIVTVGAAAREPRE